MKKLLILIAFSAVVGTVTAQNYGLIGPPTTVTTTSYNNLLDTVVNTGVKTTTPFKIKDWKNGSIWQCVVTKISGTVGGTLQLEGSLDGTNWTLVGSATTPTDGSVNYSFNTTVHWYYQRIKYTGTGTMSASIKCLMYLY